MAHKYKDSIITQLRVCMLCGSPYVEWHHVFFGRNKDNSTKYGLVVPLCPGHHRGNESPHMDRDIDLMLKAKGQKAFEEIYGHDKFMEVFDMNYL